MGQDYDIFEVPPDVRVHLEFLPAPPCLDTGSHLQTGRDPTPAPAHAALDGPASGASAANVILDNAPTKADSSAENNHAEAAEGATEKGENPKVTCFPGQFH